MSRKRNPELIAVGRAIKQIRHDRCMTLEQTAESAGLDIHTMINFEGGRGGRVLTLCMIATGLGATLREIADRAGI